MSKQEEAGLILKLYELRREETMRKARDWFIVQFNPRSIEDFTDTMFSERGAYLRMVVSYWDMVAALVNNGAIDLNLFCQATNEFLIVFLKIEPLLEQIRAAINPQFAASLEKMVKAMPDGGQTLNQMRERMKEMRARFAAMREPVGART